MDNLQQLLEVVETPGQAACLYVFTSLMTSLTLKSCWSQ